MHRLPLAETFPPDLSVWQLSLDLEGPIADEDFRLLSQIELQRACRFRRHADVVRTVATRAALRRLLSVQTGIAPEKLVFSENAFGKPLLKSAHELAFNVSHAGEYALIAVATCGHVGIDIELCRPEVELASLSALTLSPSERRDQDSGKSTLPFIDRWVVKEAVLKALGLGVADYLRAISVSPATAPLAIYHIDCSLPISSPLQAWPLLAPYGYAAALGYVRDQLKTTQ